MIEQPLIRDINQLKMCINSMMTSFSWHKTEQGSDYWNDVYINLLKLHEAATKIHEDTTMKFRKKPVVVNVWKFEDDKTDKRPKWVAEKSTYVLRFGENCLRIHTLEGPMFATKGDYIIQGVHGEIYPCKPDIFEKTYEKVETNG